MELQCQNNSFTLFGFFGNLVSPSELNRITNAFPDYSPSFLNEMTPFGPSNAIRLESKTKGIVLIVRSNSIVITETLNPSNPRFSQEMVMGFCDTVKGLLTILCENYSGNRVAIRTQCYILDLDHNYSKYIISPISQGIPDDLHISLNKLVDLDNPSLQEKINSMCNIDSAKATAQIAGGETKVLNALSIRTDINTVLERNELRFTKDNLGNVLLALAEQDGKVINELTGLLNATER